MNGGSPSPVRAFRRSVRSLLTELERKDPSTQGHAERLAGIVIVIATGRGLDRGRIRGMALAAHLHDVGKISIPDSVLLKSGPLSPTEHEVVKRHCLSGSRLIEAAGLHEISRWIRFHHERWDGTGYPNGLSGEQIPAEARILGIADALDAMIAPRSYRAPISSAAAAKELERCAGAQFDPQLAGWVAAALRRGDLPPAANASPVAEVAALKAS